MLRYLTNKRADARRKANDAFVNSIYARGAELLPEEYLLCHGPQTEAEKTAQLTKSAERRARRNRKRFIEAASQHAR